MMMTSMPMPMSTSLAEQVGREADAEMLGSACEKCCLAWEMAKKSETMGADSRLRSMPLDCQWQPKCRRETADQQTRLAI